MFHYYQKLLLSKNICVKTKFLEKNYNQVDFIQKVTAFSGKLRMPKNVRTYILLLSLIPLASISVAENATAPAAEQWEAFFNKLLEVGRYRLNFKTRRMLPPLTTLPATVTDKSLTRFKEFTTRLLDLTGDFLADNETLTMSQLLFTPKNPYEAFDFELTFDSFQKSPFNSSLETKVVVHGFREELPASSITFDIKDKLLEVGKYNVILVDWSEYSFNSFESTAVNAFYVGIQLAKFLYSLINFKQISSQSVHIIAHGLGCHAAGMVGKLIPNIGRITGLDATGFLHDDLPALLKLTHTDAEFVDAIHTHGSTANSEGIGTSFPYGHIDFYPNGGCLQPGCNYGNIFINKDKRLTRIKEALDVILCNHERALLLFLESINECPFVAVSCRSYAEFQSGKCTPQESTVANMGFRAKKIERPHENTFYFLDTSDTYPFCPKNV